MEAPPFPIALIHILLGLVILMSGRRLFWLFVGVVGFAFGFQYAPLFLEVESQWLQLALALAAGIGGALLAVFFQKAAIGVVGFIAGGFIATQLLTLLEFGANNLPWLPYAIGGILGSILLFVVFDWALIFISAFAGAGLIIQATSISPPFETFLFFGLAIFGIVLQAKHRQPAAEPKKSPPRPPS